MRIVSLPVIAALISISSAAYAIPQVNSAPGGSNAATTGNTAVTINQTTQHAVINWDNFNAPAQQPVAVFQQPQTGAITFDRIQGAATQFEAAPTQTPVVDTHTAQVSAQAQTNSQSLSNLAPAAGTPAVNDPYNDANTALRNLGLGGN